jgi:hypothetical protein
MERDERTPEQIRAARLMGLHAEERGLLSTVANAEERLQQVREKIATLTSTLSEK